MGSPSAEFTWFEGFDWQIGVCRRCRTHLGWIFSSQQADSFFGLILDHLILPDDHIKI